MIKLLLNFIEILNSSISDESKMNFAIFLICCIIATPIIIAVVKSRNANRVRIEKENFLLKYEKQQYKCLLDINDTLLLVNEEKKTWLTNDEKIHSFSDILKVELIEDNQTISTIISKKSASLGKALVGGALFGGVGAIIGGTSGKTRSIMTNNNICSKLQIKVTLNNLENPAVYFDFIKRGLSKNSNYYREVFDYLQKGLSYFEIMINNK